MTLLSVCDLDEVKVDAIIPGQKDITTAHVKRLTTAAIELGNTRSEAMVKVGGEIITTVSPDEPGNHVVVLYQDAEGKIRALTFFDPKFVIAG
jgi:tRNA(Ile2) C34 agmatinyltransferase TiaS